MPSSARIERAGRYIKTAVVGGESYTAYVPNPIPPEPPIDMSNLFDLLDKANAALGRLDGMSMVLPDSSLFLYMYIRKEAVLSSQIEGTQSSLSDLLLFESKQVPGVPLDDVTEVSRYVSAMNYGLERVKELPLSLRLLKEIHMELLSKSRGGDKNPGEFRRSQNWIGGSRPGNAKFVPPPPEYLMDCLDNFEKFLHNENVKLPILVKAAIAHVQFETIHPFLDGNGRVGRLLITFMLCIENVIKQPLLYLSLYFKARREEYYNHLQSVREHGTWEKWIEFFLTGVYETANQATETARSIIDLFDQDRKLIHSSGKSTSAILSIHSYLQHHPLVNSKKLKDETKLSLPTVLKSLSVMQELEIVKEITGRDRHKIFAYHQYMLLLDQGIDSAR